MIEKTSVLLVKQTFFQLFNFDGSYSPNHVFYRKNALISIKGAICGYLEPKKLRARPPNKAATPLEVKNIEFGSRGGSGFV